MSVKIRKGIKIGHYKVGDLISRGSMGVVYAASNIDLDSACVIKFFEPVHCKKDDHDSLLNRFIYEARVMHNECANIPGIPRVFDAFFNQESGLPKGIPPCFVMEYIRTVQGQCRTLKDMLDTEEGPLECTEENLARWFVDVATALHTLHKKGIIHRDIKPSNIFINKDSHAVVGDFGVIKVLNPEVASGLRTECSYRDFTCRQQFGTPAYLAPELLKGEEPSSASDCYALGMTFWQMTHGGESPRPWKISLMNDWSGAQSAKAWGKWKRVLPSLLSICPDPNAPDGRMPLEECIKIFAGSRTSADGRKVRAQRQRPSNLRPNILEIIEHKERIGDYERIRNEIDKWSLMQNDLEWADESGEYKSWHVINAIAKKYRSTELRCLKSWFESHKDVNDQLKDLDRRFLNDFRRANKLEAFYRALELILNEIWKLANTSDATATSGTIAQKLLDYLSLCISPQGKFIFGKFRHLECALDSRLHRGESPDKQYRGEHVADQLFLYEKTLISYKPTSSKVARQQLVALNAKNELEELPPDEIIDIRRIRQTP